MRLLLLLSGDVETNPGPFPSLPSLPSFDRKEDPVILRLEDQEDKIRKVSCLDKFSCNPVTESIYLNINITCPVLGIPNYINFNFVQ